MHSTTTTNPENFKFPGIEDFKSSLNLSKDLKEVILNF